MCPGGRYKCVLAGDTSVSWREIQVCPGGRYKCVLAGDTHGHSLHSGKCVVTGDTKGHSLHSGSERSQRARPPPGHNSVIARSPFDQSGGRLKVHLNK